VNADFNKLSQLPIFNAKEHKNLKLAESISVLAQKNEL
jgi:hypothetical protein